LRAYPGGNPDLSLPLQEEKKLETMSRAWCQWQFPAFSSAARFPRFAPVAVFPRLAPGYMGYCWFARDNIKF